MNVWFACVCLFVFVLNGRIKIKSKKHIMTPCPVGAMPKLKQPPTTKYVTLKVNKKG